MEEPSTPIAVYKAIIDRMVQEVCACGEGGRITEDSTFSRAPDHEPFNVFIRGLSREQRELLSRMLHEERAGVVHNILADLTWWISCREVAMSFRGQRMPDHLSGMGLHGDFIGRLQGWDWPNDS